MTDDVLAAMERGALVVTATRRLARRLTLDFSDRQRDCQREVWTTPDVMPWSAWLDRVWAEIAEADPQAAQQRLLNSAQTRVLWEEVVKSSTSDDPLLSSQDAAASCHLAWERINAWRVPMSALDDFDTPETKSFRDWLSRYLSRCRKGGWLDVARQSERCVKAVPRIGSRLAREIFLAGFDELAPQQESLIEALTRAGCTVARWMPSIDPVRCRRRDFPRMEDEIAAAARWARALLARDPLKSVAIVVPNLGSVRGRVQNIVDDILVPDAVLPGQMMSRDAYNLSLGTPLTDYPVVITALIVLELAGGPVSYDRWSYLMRTPFLGGAHLEICERARLDAHMRRGGELTWGLQQAGAILGEAEGAQWRCPRLVELLQRLTELQRMLPQRARPSEWSVRYRELLMAAGWPGQRPLDSREHQTVQQFDKTLAHLSTLDAIVGGREFFEAMRLLRRFARDTIFQPQGQEVPLTVLGALEAAGMQFDHLWIVGLHDRAWPPASRPNPFLPLAVQRQYGLPHSSAEREREFADRVLTRLLHSAPDVVVSHPAQQEDEKLRPSPLIKAIPRGIGSVESRPRFYREAIFAARKLERLDAEQAPVVTGPSTSGGSNILQQQAACPFRAFSLFRLGAEPLERPVFGLDPAARGRTIHKALELLWADIETQETLATLRAEELQTRVERAIRRAMARLPSRRGAAWRALLRLEQKRLAGLLAELLAVEKQRAPFTVEARETSRISRIGPLELNTRIDRIDRLSQGGRIIIDYKSGRAEVQGWFGKRPDEPQLPLYAVTNPSSLEGLAFASVAAGAVGFKGLVRGADTIPGLPAYDGSRYREEIGDWDNLLTTWKQRLHDLATRFAAGDIRVDPKHPQICTLCHLGALCRIDEIRGSLGSGDES